MADEVKRLNPTEEDVYSPEFQAVWNVIKDWDIQREPSPDAVIAGATGMDVMAILNALRDLKPKSLLDLTPAMTLEEAVYRTAGAASVCWENPGGAGIFDSTRCKQAADELIEYLKLKGVS